jgi:hypothetical protein
MSHVLSKGSQGLHFAVSKRTTYHPKGLNKLIPQNRNIKQTVYGFTYIRS